MLGARIMILKFYFIIFQLFFLEKLINFETNTLPSKKTMHF